MSDDPVQLLRRDLVEAARRRSSVASPASSRRRSWRRPRRPVALALVGLAVAGSSAAAVTGVPFGSGTTPDGSTYTTEKFVAEAPASAGGPSAGSACKRTDFRDKTGKVTSTSTACRTAGSTPTAVRKPLEVGFTVAPGASLLIEGTVGADVARVTVEGVSQPIDLVEDEDGRRAFSTLTTASKPLVRAFDGNGREIASYAVPM